MAKNALASHGTSKAVAHQADCPACKTYGRLVLLLSDATGEKVRVRCKQCDHEWHISS